MKNIVHNDLGYPQWRFAGYKLSKLSINSKRVQPLQNRTMSPMRVRRVLPAVFSLFV